MQLNYWSVGLIRKLWLLTILFWTCISGSGQSADFKIHVYNPKACTGYFFLREGSTLLILDKTGNVLYHKPTQSAGFDFNLWPNKLMSYADRGKIILMDSTFKETDSVQCKNFETDIHEFRILKNGHYLLLGSENFFADLSQFNWKGKPGNKNDVLQSAVIQELDSSKNVVFEWHCKDHFQFDEADTFYLKHDSIIDWTHVNAIEPDNDGNLLLSIRNFNTVVKINKSTGDIMWRLGGKHNQFKLFNFTGKIYGQHDVRKLSNGHLTFFMGGGHPPKHGARALEFSMDEKRKIATLLWSYTFDSAMYSERRGSFQRLDDGRAIIAFGFISRNKVTFVVVDSIGKKILQVDGEETYRTRYYPSLPWKLKKPEIECSDSGGNKRLSVVGAYNAYNWNTNDSNNSIALINKGNYFVSVPYGDGGFIHSDNIYINNTSLPCINKRRKNLTQQSQK